MSVGHALLPAYPLPMARAGQVVRVHRISGGPTLQSRLAALGFNPGIEVELIGNGVAGSYLVSVRDSRIVLGHGMARHLWVE